MPPILLVHGREDGRVPFEKYAKPLLSTLRRKSPRVETLFFPGEGHGFSSAAMTETKTAAAAFYRKHLRSR